MPAPLRRQAAHGTEGGTDPATAPTLPARPGGPRSLLVLVAAALFAENVHAAIVVPLLPRLAADGASTTALGLMVGGFPIGAIGGAIGAIVLAGRVSVRLLLVVGITMIAAGSVSFGIFIDNALALTALRVVQGVGGALAFAAGLSWLLGVTPQARRGSTIGAVMGWSIAGVAAGPLVGAAGEELGPTPSFLTIACLEVVLAVAALTLKLPAPSPLRQSAPAKTVLSLPMRRAGLILVLPAMWMGAFEVLIPLRLAELGGGAAAVAAVFTASAIGEAVISPITGWVTDRHGTLWLVRTGLLSTSLAVVAVVASSDVAVVIGLSIAAWVAVSLVWVPSVSELTGTAQRLGVSLGVTWPLTSIVLSSGVSIGSVVGSALATGTSNVVPFAVLTLCCAAVSLRYVSGSGTAAKVISPDPSG